MLLYAKEQDEMIRVKNEKMTEDEDRTEVSHRFSKNRETAERWCVKRMLDCQNLPAISKVLDVPYRSLWCWIDESEENRHSYD